MENIDLLTRDFPYKKMKPQSIDGTSVEKQIQDVAVLKKNLKEVRKLLIEATPQPKQV